nr:PLxRFG domain-containing protein [uncultured Ottowia sp.]
MGQISDFLDDEDKRREAASAGAPPVTSQAATPPASAAQPESEISRFLADAPPPERGLKGWAQDIGATAVKGAIAVPEIAVGLADLATGGHAGRAAEGLGLRFKEAKEIANDWHSEATKEAQRQFQQAEGVTGKAAAALQNPSVIATAVGESLPQMLAGGLIGRGLMLAGRIGPALAGALGEGIVGAGSAAEQIRQESPNGLLTGRQAGLAGLSGVADAGFGLLGGKMAQRLGIGDVETMLAGAGRAAAKPAAQPVAKGLPRQMAQGALSEGVLEELPQSVSEQALQNMALDRPWQEDVDSAAVLGTLSGGVMGAGASGLHGLRSRPAGTEPLKPSQRMGLDAHAGQLSAAAVVAVDSGASPAALAAAAQQGAQQGVQPGAQQGALQASAEAQQAALAARQAQGPREAASLERVAALDEQLAAARQSLAALDAQAAAPDGAQDEPQQAARAQLAQQVQQLQAERESLTQGWPRMQAGKALRFGTESGAQLAGHWALAEADQLVTSHDEGLRQNPAYPQQLQPRERSRAASEAQIARMAQRLQPERLAHSADAATGAPIVGADGLVESGNARSIALKRVYAGQGPQAAAYKDFLQAHAAEFGLMPEQVAGMQKPVLVRVRDTPVNRAEFARQANAPTVAMMSPAEQARADAARMDSMDGLEPDESGDFSGAASRGFVRRFMARLPVSEQAAMVDADGRLSSAGYARVRNAVLAKAWGTGEQGGDALARMTESLDDNTRSISRALMMAAPETARMREAIAAGARHDADIAGDVAAAAQEISRLREAGQSVQQALAQTDAFGDKHTPEARALMQFMAGNARRPRRIAQLIQAYWQALDAAGDPHQQGMFGGQAAPTKQALLQAAMRQVQDAPAQGAAQEREAPEREVQESAAQEKEAQEGAAQEREAQDRAQAAWNALPPEGRHQLALAAGVQGVVARNAARHADWSGLPAAMQQRLAQAVGAASAASGRDNAGHETTHQSAHESGVPRGLAARETADSRRLEQRINDWRRRNAMPAGMRFGQIPSQALPDALRHALDGFADATGTRVVLVRNFTPEIDDFNGVNFGDGVIYINETSQYPLTLTAAHEWLHNLRKTHPALYGQLAAEVQRQGRLPEYQQRLKRDGEPRWEQADVVQEELTAAAVGDAMTDPQFLARLAEQGGSLFARVAKSFLAFLDTLTARWRSQGSNAYLRDVQAFRDKLAAVLQAYEQQAGQAGKMGQAGLPQAMFQRVWHGTPHKGIEKTGFRLDKIGTGEGLQVYGHGIYFASRREVAEFYRGMRQGQVRLDGRLMTDGHHRGAASTGDAEVDALLLDAQGDVDQAIAWARDFGQDAQAAKLERLRGRVQRGEPGQLYAAEIPEDDDLLDWDKPLDEQPAKVRRALLELAGGLPADGRAAFRQAMARRATGQDVYAFLAQRAAGAEASAEGVQKGQRAASELLLAHGIPGLRYLDGDSRNAGEGSHNYVIWDEGLLTPEAAQIAPQYSRKQATKAAYERRIDELFAGGHASRQGAVLLDGSDVMGLLGHEHVPLVLNERHLLDGRSSHPEMTAAAWKRVPEWLENPAAVYDDPRHPGRLTVIAPETLAGYPVVMAVELEPDNPHDPRAHQLLVTAFAKTTGDLPALGFLAASGRLQYVDTKTAPVAWPDTGDVPRTAGRAHGARRILTEKSLAAWRKAQAAKAGDAPAFSLPESRASRQVKREASALKVQQAQRLVKALSRGWANAPEVVIASSVRDEALPETARRAIAQQESRSAGGRVGGFYWQGKVYLVAGNLPSMHDVARVYMHETLGHYGLRGVYGEKLNSILNRAGMAMRSEVIERARQYGFHGLGAAAKTASDAQVWDSMTDKQKLDSAEEALAYLAQTGGKVGDEKSLGLLRELVAAIRSWLRAHVPVFANLRYSDDEIMREFILPARRWVKNGSGQADDASDVMFQLAWHGTPYRGIEKTGFKLNKIGTGEGAQAYGWGIYFASQRHVAEEYRRNLTRDTPQARYEMLGKHKDMLDRQIRQGGSYLRYDEQGRVIAQGLALKDGADMKGVVIQPYSKWKLAKLKKQAAELEAQMNELRALLGPGGSIAGGQLYQTEVPEDKDLLIWDSPWNKQPLKVRRAVVNFLRQVSNGPVRPTQSDIPRIHAADALKHRIQNRKRSDALTGKDLYTAFRDIFGGPKAASEALRAAGVPGLRYLDGMSRAGGEGTYNYVIWDEALLTPEAAQIAPQYSRKLAGGFYSALQEAVETAPMKAGDAQAWKQYLTGQINKGAVKEDEVFWSGVREWLDAQPGKVSRQGVQDWLAGNHVRIEPVWEGLKYTVQDLDGDQVRFDSLQDAQAFYEELVQRAHDMVQVHEDDDEIIIEDTEDGTQETLTRDEGGVWTGDMSYEAFDTREAALQYAQSLADAWRETWQERLPQGPQRSGNRKYHEYSFADKGANYRELLLTAQVPDSHPVRQQLGVQQHAQQRAALERQQKDVQDLLQSARRLLQQAEQWQQQTGWGDDERFAYFTGQDGTRFFATRPEAEQYARQAAGITSREALLSRVRENTINALREYVAWQQKDSAEEAARLERVLAGLPAPGPMTGMLYGSNHWDTTDVIAHTRLTDFENGQTLFVEELQSDWAQDVRKGEVSAHAPFVDSTGKWLDLLLKKVLLQAAEGGYARVAFIGGQQSADRYGLDRQISRIEYDNGRLMAYRKDGGGPIRYDVQPGQLKGVIGEEAAQKLLDAPVQDGVQVIEGDDLKIGGEGMRAFYDNVVPKALGKLLKKADKSVQLQMREQPETGQKQLSFEMTPALREKLDEGLPLFSRKQATKAAYDKRIDALFAGAKPALQGVRVLDRSDVLGLLGFENRPVVLAEGKVKTGQANHPRMSAAIWKQVPEWLENPAAVFDSDTDEGLVFLAPETLGDAPISVIVRPDAQQTGDLQAHLLLNAYDRSSSTPFMRWLRDGLLRFADTKKFPALFESASGRRLPGTALQNKPGMPKILTEKHLAGWRKLHAGQAQPGDEQAHFSRRAPEPLEPRPDEAARLKESALEQLDRVFKHPGTVSWWHKTVGTMRNLAERQPLFKPVYEAAQQFIDDVSHFANDAADFAPRLLPRLESWRDLGKRAVSAADSQAVAAPLFEGTLSYTRGKDGSLVKTDNVDAAGVVFTDAELKGRFGLTPAQIELYRQARAAIDRSIDTTARADILRLAGRDFAHLRQAVMDAPDLRAAAVQVVEAMQEVMQSDAKRRDAMREAIEAAQERVQTAQALMQRGYAPLTRFGRYTLDVVDAQGQRQYFGLYESRREANVAAIHMRSQYPGAQVTQGTLSDDAYKLFAGITPESLELFGDLLAAPGQGKDKGQDKAFQAWLQLARNNRSAIKRLIHRKGVAGYSQDAGRVLASFIYANARQTAGALNAGRMDRAIAAIPKEQGQLRDVAMALRDYTQNPREEGQAIRGMLFAQYLGGSLASAAVNMTQPFAVTLPWLSQFGGMRQAAAQMTRALADMTRPGHRYEADLARDMAKAEEDGVVSPQEIHQLMAQARGAGALRSGDGTRRGDALAAAANAWERLKVAWGQPFALAEQFNRRSTYIAAWRLARQQGMADADAFARRAVLETQFVYTKANKPRWGRGAVGGALFTFKTYSVSYLELMHRMWTQGGTPGKQGVAWMLAMLLLMGGAGGLPFMEDAEDLIDGLAQLAGYNTSVKQWRRQALQDIVGDGLAEFIESGVSGLPGAPIDISGRLGMGNLLPGTGLLLTKQNRERDLLDVAGPAGDLLARGFTAGRKLLTGDAGGAAMELAPTAARNLAKGADMLATGSYRDAKGYKVLDTTALEALAKAAGFQPRSVAQVQEGNSFLMRSKSFYQHTSAEIKAQWARALFEKDEAALQRVRQRVADWNRRNPEQPITVRMPDIWRRVREMGKERSQRIADSAPRALRQQMRQALAQEG